LSEAASKRLEVMQTLDTLGAGFQLASHDLDIRGAGNLLGEEQSGHIREVGIELYQQLLEEAVASAARAGRRRRTRPTGRRPSISASRCSFRRSMSPTCRCAWGLYRRLGGLDTQAEVDSFAAELVDRFGQTPPEAEFLLKTISLKLLWPRGLRREDRRRREGRGAELPRQQVPPARAA
jgi:transcription-repair coupling factor (superfamily II helicase)